jgi:hypothetical protein
MQTSFGPFSTIHKMLEYALDLVLDAVRAEAGGVYLLDEDREALELTVHRGLPEARVREIEHLELGQGLTGRVALTGKPIVIRNVRDPQLARSRSGRTQDLRDAEHPDARQSGVLEGDLQLVTSMACQIGLRSPTTGHPLSTMPGGIHRRLTRVARAQPSRPPALRA